MKILLADKLSPVTITELEALGATVTNSPDLTAEQLPEQIVNLPKKGFSMPLGEWMKSELKDWSHSVIFDNREQWEPYLKNETVKLMWNQHQSGKIDHSSRLWQIAVLSMN